jgi:hypothetical protein
MVAFNRLDPFITDWDTLAASGANPKFTPVHALDPWIGNFDDKSDSRLMEYIRRNLVSNCSHDGVNRREMLAAVSGDLSQMAFKSDLRGLWNSSSGGAAMSDEWVDDWWERLRELVHHFSVLLANLANQPVQCFPSQLRFLLL